ncbi:MAG: hypothetical protein ACYC77_03565 [Coriobacteriia bacterium]
MKRALIVLTIVMVLIIGSAVPAFAGSAGSVFGLHHADMARMDTGFTGAHNPGVLHEGFSNWPGLPE